MPPIEKEKLKALEQALQQIDRQFGKGALVRLGDKPQEAIQAISTGSINLDAALGIGGVPRGRVTEIYGPESSGKTTLTLHIIAEAQKLGGLAAFIDAEHALDAEYAKKLGVDIDNLMVSQPDSGEQALEIAEALVRSAAVDIVVIDSVAALVPKAELEGEMGDAMVGLQARLMSQALRKLTAVVSKSSTCLIFINQIREKIGVMFGNPETTTGGRALKFYSSVRLDIRRINSIKDGDEVVGQPDEGQGRQEQGRPAVQGRRVRHRLRRGDLEDGRADRPRGRAQDRREERRLVQLRRPADRPGARERQGLPPRQRRHRPRDREPDPREARDRAGRAGRAGSGRRRAGRKEEVVPSIHDGSRRGGSPGPPACFPAPPRRSGTSGHSAGRRARRGCARQLASPNRSPDAQAVDRV